MCTVSVETNPLQAVVTFRSPGFRPDQYREKKNDERKYGYSS